MKPSYKTRASKKLAAPFAVALLASAALTGMASGHPVPISSIEKEGDYLPIERVRPKYPRSAYEAGTGGHVVLELTVQKDGHVWAESIKVVKSEPAGVFDKVAKDAAMQFVYQPTMVDGKATSVSGVRYKFSFDVKK